MQIEALEQLWTMGIGVALADKELRGRLLAIEGAPHSMDKILGAVASQDAAAFSESCPVKLVEGKNAAEAVIRTLESYHLGVQVRMAAEKVRNCITAGDYMYAESCIAECQAAMSKLKAIAQ